MQNINDSSKINSYSFDNSNNKLSFLSIDSESVNGEYKNKNNLSSFNPLNEYKNEKNTGTFTKDDILLSVADYVTNDFGIVISFASMLNLKELAENETFVYAKFNLDEKENLVFTLVELVGLDTFVDYARGTFKNINNSTSKLEDNSEKIRQKEIVLIQTQEKYNTKKSSLDITNEEYNNIINELRSLENLVDSSLSKEEDRIMKLYYETSREKEEVVREIARSTKEKDKISSTIDNIEATNKLNNTSLYTKEKELKK